MAAVGISSDPHTYYLGATGGGVWKTTNGGGSWTSLFDKQAVSSIGAIAVAEADPNVVYVGTGEACIRGNLSHGDGVYKSTDAGKTWTHVGLRDTLQIGDLLVHPRNPDLVYVAALGHVYGANSGARRVPLARRRQDLGEGPLQGRPDRRRGPGDGSVQSQHPLRHALGSRPHALEHDERRTRQRPLPLERRRDDLEEGRRQRLARRRAWQDRRGRVRRRQPARLRDRRGPGREGRPLPIRRRRRALEADDRRPPAAAPALVLHPRHGRPEAGRHALRAERRPLPLARRRQVVGADRDAARRLPSALDRPARLEAHGRGERRRRDDQRGRRGDLEPPGQPADRAVLPRQRGRPVALHGLRLPAGQLVGRDPQPQRPGRHHAARTGTPSAAARPATSRRHPTARRSTPASTSASSRASTAPPARRTTSRSGPTTPTATRPRT